MKKSFGKPTRAKVRRKNIPNDIKVCDENKLGGSITKINLILMRSQCDKVSACLTIAIDCARVLGNFSLTLPKNK
jgi:hypothetical protein